MNETAFSLSVRESLNSISLHVSLHPAAWSVASCQGYGHPSPLLTAAVKARSAAATEISKSLLLSP